MKALVAIEAGSVPAWNGEPAIIVSAPVVGSIASAVMLFELAFAE
jgi:hypothetical protein